MAKGRTKAKSPKAPVTPDIGFNSPHDWLEYNVLPALAEFSETPQRASAIRFAKAAWHLHDRLWHQRGKPNREKFVAGLFAACPDLARVRDLADAGKHHQLDRPSVTLAGIAGAEGGGTSESCGPFGMTSSMDRGSLAFVDNNGSRYDLHTMFRQVVRFWQSEIKK